MKRVVLAGYLGHGNLGDEAMLAGTLAWLRGLGGVEPVVLSRDPARTRREHACAAEMALPTGKPFWPRMLARPSRWRSLVALRRADAAIWLAGSGVFSDARGPIMHLLWPTLALVRRLAPRMAILSATAGPLVDPSSIALTQRAVAACDVIGPRDAASMALLRQVAGPGLEDRLTPMADAAFWLDPPVGPDPDVWNALTPIEPGRAFGVCIPHFPADSPGAAGLAGAARASDRREQFLDALASAIDGFAEAGGLTPLVIPMQAGLDEPIAAALAGRLRPPARVLLAPGSPTALLGLFAGLRLIVGMRLHALVLGTLAGIPPVGIVYDEKARAFLDEIGLGDRAVDYYVWRAERPPLDAERLKVILMETLRGEDQARRHIDQARRRLRQVNQDAGRALAGRLLLAPGPRDA
jgi:polysaccharide pyruvyl transferase WcaK-like protein